MPRILIIEDNEPVREVLALMLKARGHETATAKDGVEGMALLETFAPDLVIADLHMPNMDGIETVRAVRRRFPDLKFIGISGAVPIDHPGTESGLEAMAKLGATRTLAKPFSRAQFVATVEEVLSG